jgi:hypothetical protein
MSAPLELNVLIATNSRLSLALILSQSGNLSCGLPVNRAKHFMALEHSGTKDASLNGSWELWTVDIKALDQAVFDSKHRAGSLMPV